VTQQEEHSAPDISVEAHMGLFQRMFGAGASDPAQAAAADMNQAIRLYRQGSFQAALSIADRLIAGGPGIALSWRFRGECLFSLQRYEEAVASFDRAGELGGPGTDDVFLWSSLALHNGGKSEEAKARLRDALTSTALTPELHARTESALKTLEESR
jgi:tetratricopeptide (TPR) repeat protein